MGKFLKIVFNILLTIIIVLLLTYFGLRSANIIKIYNVETGSMEDKIHAGDYILMYKKKNYYVGDVVTFKVNDYYVTHRIVEIDGNKITTKGDANNPEDDKINFDQIEGKVVYWGGILNIIINYKYVITAFLIGIYLLSCYFESNKDKDTINTENSDILENNLDSKKEIDIEKTEIEDTSLKDEKLLENDSNLINKDATNQAKTEDIEEQKDK